jgi:type I restriction enzyme R subunit
MPLFSEKSLVEDYFIQKTQEKGWKFIPADNLERENLEEPLLTPTLIRALKRLNANIGVGDEEIRQVLNELKLRTSGSEDAKKILNYLKDGIPVKFEKERVVKYIRLFDYDNTQNNNFTISRQVIHQSGDKQIRNDIILYINGIPIANIECKNPTSLTENWYTAYKQIIEYWKTVPEPYKYIQIGIAAAETARYFATAPWQEETLTHQWRETNKDPIDSTIEMLTPNTLLNIIKHYLFFRIEHGTTTKVITRYMQYRASEQIVNRVLNNISGKETKNKGLIWHWQGSGKTLTMIFAANKLYRHPTLENPTIFFIVDREELETQLYEEFTALDITKPETIDSINALRAIIKHDENRGKRGIFITLIHKFRPEELAELQKELDTLSQTRETIQSRKNVILFIDEAHRTQYGLLAAQMKQTLKNAMSYAFTGTPIAKTGRDTYQEFSYPDDPHGRCLDKYFIIDSITDGFTLKIAYQPRLEKDVHLKKEMLDTFIQIEIIDEIPEEYREKTEEKIKQKLNAIKVFLENTDRIKLVAQDIAQHFKENLDGKFKALIVAVNRVSCVRYKRELDKLLPKEYSEVVMTFNRTDPPEIQDYLKELTARYHGKEIEDIRKEIIDKYKEDDLPKILIVTDMLLTGFDAPILQTMYLDKPLKEHRLLQAIARTNRPYKDLKTAGLIIDYVGILKEFTRAFENYTKEDITGVLLPIDELAKEFTQTLDETTILFQDIPKDQDDRQTLLKAFEAITTEQQNTKKFRDNYRHLRRLFELLGTHDIKLQKLKEYSWLTQIYNYYIKSIREEQYPEQRYVQKYFPKTLKYVYKTTELSEIDRQYPIIQFDVDYLKNLQEKIKTKEEKAANILFTLNRFILVDKTKNPIYETLTEKVERILKLWKEKTKDFDKIYDEGTKIIEEINQLQSRQKQLDFTDLQYSILLTMEKTLGTDKNLTQDAQELTTQLRPHMFKGWQYQQTTRKTIEREVRKYLRKYIKQYGLVLADLEQLYQKITESVKTYG